MRSSKPPRYFIALSRRAQGVTAKPASASQRGGHCAGASVPPTLVSIRVQFAFIRGQKCLTRYNRHRMDIFDEIIRLRRLGQKCALATIVQVNGSIPSYESAKLLVREDGSMMGTIGGGGGAAYGGAAPREGIRT